MKSVSASLFGLSMVVVSTFTTVQVTAAQSVGSAPTVMIMNGEQDAQPRAVVTAQYQPVTTTANSVNTTDVAVGNKQTVYIESPNQPQPTLPVRDVNEVPVDELTVITPSTPSMPANAFEARRNIPVQYIQASPEGARLNGNIRGLEVDIYHFSGQQGQTVHIVHNKSNPAIEAAIFRPSMGIKFGSTHVLPESGEYELRIVQTRQDAARNKTPRYYDIIFQVQ